jgi:glycosyltransferase involved in cell wall biosynthesis
MTSPRPSVLFLGSMYAGHRTRFLNLKEHSHSDARIDAQYREVTGWRERGAIERVPAVPRALKGRLRALAEGSAIAGWPRPDAIWTAAGTVLSPYAWSQIGPLRRPMVLDLDWTLEQQEELAPIYFGRAPKRGLRLAAARAQERIAWSAVSVFTPWSAWAADALRRAGIDDEKIRVIPPGVDLKLWAMPERYAPRANAPLRLLFVGGDFERKGGDMLADAVVCDFRGVCELDIVTTANVNERAGVRVHRAAPNSPELRELYARADLFVLPTRAECFGIATVEAMASGLPVIAGDVGGVRDIVEDGVSGWLIAPRREALAGAIRRALEQRERLPAMGAKGREIAERRFNGERNDGAIVDLLLELIERRQSEGGR